MSAPANEQPQHQAQGQAGQRLQEPAADALPVQWDSTRLFDGQRELIIHHQGEQYRLRITRQDKLILTK